MTAILVHPPSHTAPNSDSGKWRSRAHGFHRKRNANVRNGSRLLKLNFAFRLLCGVHGLSLLPFVGRRASRKKSPAKDATGLHARGASG